MQIGDIREGIVTRVEPFGLFVDANGVPGLLLIPELSWDPVHHPAEVAQVGDRVRFQILHLIEPPKPEAHFTGSIKLLFPEQNPWHDSTIYRVGDSFRGVVMMRVEYGYWVMHPRRARALLRFADAAKYELAVGENVGVTIRQVIVEGEYLVVALG